MSTPIALVAALVTMLACALLACALIVVFPTVAKGEAGGSSGDTGTSQADVGLELTLGPASLAVAATGGGDGGAGATSSTSSTPPSTSSSVSTTTPPTSTTDPDTLGGAGDVGVPTKPPPTTAAPPPTTAAPPPTTAAPPVTSPPATSAPPTAAPPPTRGPVVTAGGASATTGVAAPASTTQPAAPSSTTTPTPSAPPTTAAAAPGAVRTVPGATIVSGRSDPVTPPSLAERREESLTDQLLIAVDLPGAARTIGIAVRPSRMAAAWLVWVTATLLVIAFWLPLPGRRGRGRRAALAASSVPIDRRPRT